ncbi:unnamed protein product, partial [Prorocentrum cordatum]
MRALVAPSRGRVLLALRLPVEHYVLTPAMRVEAPEEALLPPDRPSRASGVWEEELNALVAVLEGAGLAVECWSRVPYVCQGEHPVTHCHRTFTALDDAVLVCSALQ